MGVVQRGGDHDSHRATRVDGSPVPAFDRNAGDDLGPDWDNQMGIERERRFPRPNTLRTEKWSSVILPRLKSRLILGNPISFIKNGYVPLILYERKQEVASKELWILHHLHISRSQSFKIWEKVSNMVGEILMMDTNFSSSIWSAASFVRNSKKRNMTPS